MAIQNWSDECRRQQARKLSFCALVWILNTKGKLPIETFSMIISKQSLISSLKGHQYTIFFWGWRELRRHQLRYFLCLLYLATGVKEMYDNSKRIDWRVVYWLAYFDQNGPPSFLLTLETNGPMKLLVVLPNQSDCVLFQSFNQWNCFIYRSTRVVSVCFKPQTKHFDQPCCGVVPILLERWSILCRTKTMKNNKKMWSLWTDLLMEERRRLFTDLTQLLALKYDDTSQQIKEKARTWTGQMPFSWEDGSAESECSWIITYNTCWG